MPAYTRITTPYTAQSTADDVIAGLDLLGRRALVTGGDSGLGAETARALAAAGASVTLGVRDVAAGERTAIAVAAMTGNRNVSVGHLDLADRASVWAFAALWDGPLDILVNNAGVIAPPDLRRTPQGWELQFATNHLGHFGLALALHDALTETGDARIVSVSSSAHRLSPIVFDDLQFQRRPYDPWLAYGQSKTANVLFAVEATKRWAPDRITVNAVMPGNLRTTVHRHQPDDEAQDVAFLEPSEGWQDAAPLRESSEPWQDVAPLSESSERCQDDAQISEASARWQDVAATRKPSARWVGGRSWKTVEQAAATSVMLAVSPLLEGIGGRYFEDGNEAELTTDPDQPNGVRPYALDPDEATHLWNTSIDLLGT